MDGHGFESASDHDDDATRETRRPALHNGWDESSFHAGGEALRRTGARVNPYRYPGG